MFGTLIHFLGSFRKGALLLLGVYSIHMVCLLALMSMPVITTSGNAFKPLFTSSANHTKKIPGKRTPHPASTYFAMLVKQGKFIQRTLLVSKCVGNAGSEVVLPVIDHLQQLPICENNWYTFCLPANPSGRYLLFRRIVV